MRLDLYKLKSNPENVDLGPLLKSISAAPLENRNRSRGLDTFRLEAIEQRQNLWLCDFTRIRMHHGPGRSGLKTATKGFDLAADEGFGEETAFLWDAATGWCVAQYNHYGVRASAIAEYIALFDHANPLLLELLPKLDEQLHAKIKAKKLVSKFEFTVAPRDLTDDDYELGGGLGAAVKALKKSDAERVHISVATSVKSGLDVTTGAIWDWIKGFGGASEGSPISSARVSAREDESDPLEVLDLLKQRITGDAELTPGKDKRYSQHERWNALEQAHTKWKRLMK